MMITMPYKGFVLGVLMGAVSVVVIKKAFCENENSNDAVPEPIPASTKRASKKKGKGKSSRSK